MAISRRRALGLMGSTVALPVFGRDAAAAHAIIPRGAAFRLDSNQAGDLTAPALEQTSDGGFLATWQQKDAGVDRVWGRYYTSTGVPIGAPIQIGGTGARVGMPVAFGSGLFGSRWSGAAFLYQDAGIGSDIYAQIMTPTRTKDGPPVKLNTRTVGDQSGVRAERLNCRIDWINDCLFPNNFAAAWTDATGIGRKDIRSRQFHPWGEGASVEISPTPESAGIEELVDLAPLVGGGAVLSYRTGGVSKLQQLRWSGVRYGAPILLGTSSRAGVTGLPRGGFAAAWRENYGPSRRMRVQFYAQNGAAGTGVWLDIMDGDQSPIPNAGWDKPRPYLVAMPDGRLVIVYKLEIIQPISIADEYVISSIGVMELSPTGALLARGRLAADIQNPGWAPHTTFSVNSLIRLMDGNFVVSWAEAIDDKPPHIVMARRFSAV